MNQVLLLTLLLSMASCYFSRLNYFPNTFLDLFERLRALRGNKTMIFSSHRFGNLTRHADHILCVPALVADFIV